MSLAVTGLSWLIKFGFGGIADKALAHLQTRAELQNDAERLRSETTIALAKEAVNEAKVMADFNKAKLAFPWFWMFAGMFLFPLALWWNAVILDSIPYFNRIFGTEQVANLPTPQMQEWAGNMIQWLFYVGTGVGALKAVRR